jgi:hypothetical protein
MLAGNRRNVSSWRRRCLTSRPTIRTRKADACVVLLRVSRSEGPCMSDCRKGIRYGRAWLMMKWLTLNSSATRRKGESRSV